MTDAALDASVVIKWFAPRASGTPITREHTGACAKPADRLHAAASTVRDRQPRRPSLALGRGGTRLAAALDALGFEHAEPDLRRVAHWTARGLTAYDGAYVAVAEAIGARLITDDDLIVEIAEEIAQPLAAAHPDRSR